MNRLILLEGLPGTGKTTNSYMIFEQMVRNGRDVRWLHEVSQPHPMLFFSESCLTKEANLLTIRFAVLVRSVLFKQHTTKKCLPMPLTTQMRIL